MVRPGLGWPWPCGPGSTGHRSPRRAPRPSDLLLGLRGQPPLLLGLLPALLGGLQPLHLPALPLALGLQRLDLGVRGRTEGVPGQTLHPPLLRPRGP